MLVLSRKEGERIVIGENLVVTILECSSGRVRLGFEAPRDVTIWRAEIRNEFWDRPVPLSGRNLALLKKG